VVRALADEATSIYLLYANEKRKRPKRWWIVIRGQLNATSQNVSVLIGVAVTVEAISID
jgi:hypothetical protein